MKRTILGTLTVLGFLLVSASPAEAQLFNFPVYAPPSSAATGPSTFVFGTFGGGLNDQSGKNNAVGAGIGRTGIADRVTVFAGGGLVLLDDPADDELTLGGAVGIDLLPNVGLAAGLGWMSPSGGTLLHIPVGVSLGTSIESESATVSPWVMPRVSFNRVSPDVGDSNTETDFGVSGGVAINLASGLGFHAALDVLIVEDFAGDNTSSVLFGGGVHYTIN